MKNIGRYRLRIELAVRWLVWLVWVVVWPVVIWNVSPGLLALILLVSVWIIGGWFGFFLWGPGNVYARVLEVKDRRGLRRFNELNARFSKVSPDDPPYYELDEYDYEEIEREMDQENDDYLFGVIINSGGKSSTDYRVVPADVRPWFEPYVATDGIMTLHEDSFGVSLEHVYPDDPMFGDNANFSDEDWEEDYEEEDYEEEDYEEEDYEEEE